MNTISPLPEEPPQEDRDGPLEGSAGTAAAPPRPPVPPHAAEAPFLRLPEAVPDLPVEPLRSVDYAWMRMDEPANLMIINGAMVFDEPLDEGRVREVMEQRLMGIRRFRQRVVRPSGGRWPVWQESPDMDLDRHLVVHTLPSPGGQQELSAFIGGLMGQSLDPQHPPWVYYLVQGYQGGSALVGRLHHCLGDGIALMLVLLSMADLVPDGQGLELDHADTNPFRALFDQAMDDLKAVREATERVMPDGMKLLLRPAQALQAAGKLATGMAATDALGRLVLRGRDPSTPFKGPLGVPKRCAWSERLDLEEVRRVARGTGGSINDVLSAALAGGLRRYMLEQGEPPESLAFRAAVPVNLRPLAEMAQLGNRFGLVFLSLPVGIPDPVNRIAEVRRRMRSLKRSAEPLVVYQILRALGRSPLAVQKAVVRLLATKTTAVLTSVPGPQQTLYMAGRAIRDVFFWVPQAGRVGLGLSICSYAGQVRLGIATDAGLIPDPTRIVTGFHEEFDEMTRHADRHGG